MYHSLYFPPAVIVLAILIATVFGWSAARTSLNQGITTAANMHVHSTEQSIESSMAAYEEILQGGVGLLQGSDEVTRADWTHYLQAFQLNQNYPGVQGIGFIRLTTPDQAPGLAAYMASQGVPNFTIQPISSSDTVYAPLTYVQLVASHGQIPYGFNMYSDPSRKAALLHAEDSGMTTITGGLAAAGSADGTTIGFNMYIPYYRVDLPISNIHERRSAILGYTFAAFRADVFFGGIGKGTDSANAGFRIAVQGEGAHTNLYQSPHFEAILKKNSRILVSRHLTLYGETWDMQYAFDKNGLVSSIESKRPAGILFSGTFVAVLIGVIVLLLLRARSQELTVQKERAVELAKDELLSLASHQLRTPATGVKQYVGMVLQGFAGHITTEQTTLLEKAYASNDRQLQIINEILHLAKIDAGRIVLAPTPTDLNELITDIVTEQRPDIQAANHGLKLELPKKPVIIQADSHMLRMAIENVLSNAIKYTPSSGKIGIRLFQRIGHTYIRITDNGVGIAKHDQREMFKQFTRLPNEMSQHVGGTGIGLYLAKHLVELHGGAIVVDSKQGKGSTLTIILPTKV